MTKLTEIEETMDQIVRENKDFKMNALLAPHILPSGMRISHPTE